MSEVTVFQARAKRFTFKIAASIAEVCKKQHLLGFLKVSVITWDRLGESFKLQKQC